MSFWKVDWGKDEANGDDGLVDYFYPIPGYAEILTGQKRYVIGRKGTGKTAICERLRLEALSKGSWFTANVSLRGFPLNSLRALRNRAFKDKSQYLPIWSFLIAAEFTKLVAKDPGAAPGESVSSLREFIALNFPFGGISETLQSLEQTNGSIVVNSSWLGSTEGGQVRVRFERVTPWLLHQLKTVSCSSYYFVLMDELDEGYAAGDASLRLMLLALLRATEDFALLMQRERVAANYRPLLVLRSDIYDKLEDNDLNKYDDAVIKLRWNASPTAAYSLRGVVNARVNASLGLVNIADPWTEVAVDNDSALPPQVANLWNYLSHRTFERPRDILKFLKCCRDLQGEGRLAFGIVRVAENSYSDWFYNELRDEMHAHLGVWAEALSCLTRVGRGILTVDDLRLELDRDPAVVAWMKNNNKTHDFIMGQLFDFSIIGNLTKDTTWSFKYKDHTLKWNPNAKLIVHYGLHKKLRLRPGVGRVAHNSTVVPPYQSFESPTGSGKPGGSDRSSTLSALKPDSDSGSRASNGENSGSPPTPRPARPNSGLGLPVKRGQQLPERGHLPGPSGLSLPVRSGPRAPVTSSSPIGFPVKRSDGNTDASSKPPMDREAGEGPQNKG